MTNFKKTSLFTTLFALILGLSVTTSYAQMKDKAHQPEAYKLTGKVVDAESGEALTNAKVNIPGKNRKEMTGKEGTFTFKELPAGTHTVKVQEDGYKTWTKKVNLNKDSRLSIEVKPVK